MARTPVNRVQNESSNLNSRLVQFVSPDKTASSDPIVPFDEGYVVSRFTIWILLDHRKNDGKRH
jgi:hypothetical protein